MNINMWGKWFKNKNDQLFSNTQYLFAYFETQKQVRDGRAFPMYG